MKHIFKPLLVAGILLPLALGSCKKQQPEMNIDLTVVTDYSEVLNAIDNLGNTLIQKLQSIEGTMGSEDLMNQILEAVNALPGTLDQKVEAILEAISSSELSLTSKLGLIETALTNGFADQGSALDMIKTTVQGLETTLGGMSGLSGKLDELSTTIDQIAQAAQNTNTKLDGAITTALANILTAIEGQTDYSDTLSDIQSELDKVLKALDSVSKIERQWIHQKGFYDEDNDTYYDRIFDFGYTHKNNVYYWDLRESEAWNQMSGYEISIAPNGWIKVSSPSATHFYMFEEVTETTATMWNYAYDPWTLAHTAGVDEYGWHARDPYHFEALDPARELPIKPSLAFNPMDNNHTILNYEMRAGSFVDDYDSKAAFVETFMGGDEAYWVSSLPFVLVPNYGEEADYEGLDVEGAIVVVSRGQITYAKKLEYASNAGAGAMICYNNEDTGVQGANLYSLSSDVKKIPFFFISKEAGEWLLYAIIYPELFQASIILTVYDPNNLYQK